jgi:hypothetical protein
MQFILHFTNQVKDYITIDRLLQAYASKTCFADRKHPEEFSTAFHRRMKGTWSIPRRNKNFVAREKELQDLWAKFITGGAAGMHKISSNTGVSTIVRGSPKQIQHQMVVKVEIAGFAGVGKSQLATEYCYRYYPTEYGLVVWLNAESAELLVADYRQLLLDLSPENASEVIANTPKSGDNAASSAIRNSSSDTTTSQDTG